MGRYIITGGTKGLGRALAREFVSKGNDVLITSRRKKAVLDACREVKREARMLPNYISGGKVYGVECDITNYDSVVSLKNFSHQYMDEVDGWICNAGQSGSYKDFIDQDTETIKEVVNTNLFGTMLCAQQALQLFKEQNTKGSIFFVDGAGADGISTPGYAVYGSTKAGIRQLWESMKEESNNMDIYIHMLSPGMVLTPLLLEGTNTEELSPVFNILCEQPEVPAAFLAIRANELLNTKENCYIRYLSIPRITWRFMTSPFRRNKHFDEDTGLKLYSDKFEIRVQRYSNDIIRERESKKREMLYVCALGTILTFSVFA